MVQLTADFLKQNQSVRATFKLPEKTISLLAMVARHLGIKQKSLFDQLNGDPAVLEQVMRDSRKFVQDQGDRSQKTFVISRNSLATLNATAKRENISRDLLLEISINRLLAVMVREIKQHKKRKKIAAEMTEHLLQKKKLKIRAGRLLGNEDRLCEMLDKQLQLAHSHIDEIETMVEHGAALEAW
jgi:hypothetical protein